ncbi:MAG TPA: ABC transporter permease, partial [Negativicutes bacterium]|nr:ABC transporter permease [Negativicutes bacterium]
VVGMVVKDVEDIGLVNNFFITPMIFFGGSFFPIHNLPSWLAVIVAVSPIDSLNTMLRVPTWNADVLRAAGMMAALTGGFFGWTVWLYNRYSE